MKLHLKDCSYTKNEIKYEYYAIAQSIRKNGKNQKEPIAYLGKLSKEQVANYRLFLKAINEEQPKLEFFGDLRTVIYEEQKRYLDVLILNELWLKLNIDSVFDKKMYKNQKLSTENVARILTLNKMLEPTSKIGTVRWLETTLLPAIMEIDEQHYNKDKIFRELTEIHKNKEKIEGLFLNFSRNNFEKTKECKDDCEIYYFDGTTSWFEGQKCCLAEFSEEKTRSYYPYVVGFILVTDKQGYPVAWEVVPGKTRDVSCFKDIANRIHNKFKVKEVTYCFDRGVASAENFEAIEGLRSKFISGIKDNQIKDVFDLSTFRKKTLPKLLVYCQLSSDERRGQLPINGFYSAGDSVFYNDLGVIGSNRYILSFNKEVFELESLFREKAIEKTLNAVSDLNSQLREAQKSREFQQVENTLVEIMKKNKVKVFFDYTIIPKKSINDAQSYQIKLELNKAAIEESAQTDGLMVYITDHVEKRANLTFDMSAYEIIKHYKEKYVIEDAFKNMKSFLDLQPIFVWTEDHVKAHFDITVMSYFINNYIYRQLAESRRSFGEFISTLSTFNNDVNKLKTYAKQEDVNLRKLFDKEKIKKITEEVIDETPLSMEFYKKVLAYTESISLSEFYRCIKENGSVVKLAAPNNLKIYKQHKIDENTKDILRKLELTNLLSPKQHKTVHISQ